MDTEKSEDEMNKVFVFKINLTEPGDHCYNTSHGVAVIAENENEAWAIAATEKSLDLVLNREYICEEFDLNSKGVIMSEYYNA